jgi:hypothetical protein
LALIISERPGPTNAQEMPSPDKHAACALAAIAFRLERIDQKFEQLIAVLASLTKS